MSNEMIDNRIEVEVISFKAKNDEGVEVEYDVLFDLESDETKKHYIIFTDHTQDEDGNNNLYASIYNYYDGETIVLEAIKTDREWAIIGEFLSELQNAADNGSILQLYTRKIDI